MHIVVFGASGNVGQLIVEQALAAGHSVTAIVHNSTVFDDRTDLVVKHVDSNKYEQVAAVIKNADAVLSALGSWNTTQKNIVSAGIENIVKAMQEHGIQRLITLTGSGAYWSQDKLRPVDTLSHLLLTITAPKILQDGEAHNRIVETSNLDWTIVRSPIMKDGPVGNYRLDSSIGSPFATVSRATVAQVMLEQLSDTTQIHRAPVIRKSRKSYSSK